MKMSGAEDAAAPEFPAPSIDAKPVDMSIGSTFVVMNTLSMSCPAIRRQL